MIRAAGRDRRGQAVPPTGSHGEGRPGPGLGGAAGVQVGHENVQFNYFYELSRDISRLGAPEPRAQRADRMLVKPQQPLRVKHQWPAVGYARRSHQIAQFCASFKRTHHSPDAVQIGGYGWSSGVRVRCCAAMLKGLAETPGPPGPVMPVVVLCLGQVRHV